jgi:hypothetical protein
MGPRFFSLACFGGRCINAQPTSAQREVTAMTPTPHTLLDISIAQLQTLASFLAEEMGTERERESTVSPETRACKEILLTLSVLIPKLQAARYVIPRDSAAQPEEQCEACKEG